MRRMGRRLELALLPASKTQLAAQAGNTVTPSNKAVFRQLRLQATCSVGLPYPGVGCSNRHFQSLVLCARFEAGRPRQS